MNALFKMLLAGGLLCWIIPSFSMDSKAAQPWAGNEVVSQTQQGQEKEEGTKPPVQVKKPPMQNVGPGAQLETPLAAKIEDIDAHRRKPIPFIRSYGERVDLDLAGVDFDADVVAVIDGEPVTRDLLRSYLIMFVGSLEVDSFVTALLTEIGQEIRIADGADPKDFEVSEARVDKQIENMIRLQQQMKQMPEMDLEAFKERIDATFGWERYRDLIRATTVFEKVFIPEIQEKAAPEGEEGAEEEAETAQGEGEAEEEELDPDLPIGMDSTGKQVNIYIPMVTWNVLGEREQEKALRDMLNKQYKDASPLNEFLRPQFARTVKEALLRSLDVEYFYTGNLDPGVFLRVEDKELMLKDVYAVVEDRVTREDEMLALREILLCKGMDRALKEAGCYPTEEEYQAAFRAHEKEYEGTIFPLEFIIRLHGYLNMHRYKNLYRRRAGFEKLIADELQSDEALKEFYESAARLLYENGSVKLQAIFFGIFDHSKQQLRENGYEWALEQMGKVTERLKAGEDFEALAREFHDPAGTFTTFDFQLLSRQQLRQTLGDTPKSALISGFSLSDYIFYRAKTDEIVGPVVKYWGDVGNPTHKGVFLVRVKEFRRSQVLKDYEISKKMVVVDYGDLKFNWWAQEALKGSEVQLTLR